jgi:hypothetical protein
MSVLHRSASVTQLLAVRLTTMHDHTIEACATSLCTCSVKYSAAALGTSKHVRQALWRQHCSEAALAAASAAFVPCVYKGSDRFSS